MLAPYRKTSLSAALFAATALLALPAGAQTDRDIVKPLTGYEDQAPIIISGTVGEIRSDEFDLDYGPDMITVELDTFGWTGNETRYLIPGESVTVSGRIDDDLFEGREIEADSVRLNDSGIYYYVADAAPVYYYTYDPDMEMEDGAFVSMTGTVSAINDEEFTLTNATRQMIVDTEDLGYNPLDDEGLQQIDIGDRVYAYGEIDEDFFEEQELEAMGVVSLEQSGR